MNNFKIIFVILFIFIIINDEVSLLKKKKFFECIDLKTNESFFGDNLKLNYQYQRTNKLFADSPNIYCPISNQYFHYFK